jgi:hypothetical protein
MAKKRKLLFYKTAPQEELDTMEELRHHIIIPSSMFFQPGASFFPS